MNPPGLSIVGKTETENIGVEKIIQNTLAVPWIRYLILCGRDSAGHFSGHTLACLHRNGVDSSRRVIGSKGRKPVLANVTAEEITAFRSQVETIDLIGCEDVNLILDRIKALTEKNGESFPEKEPVQRNVSFPRRTTEIIRAEEKKPSEVLLDKNGYFVIVPNSESGLILVEHYNNRNELMRIVQGSNARNIYWTIIENGWISELSHAAYLGKELTLAEQSIKQGTKYVQDKA